MTGALALRAHGESHVGKVRDHNEDALIVDRKWGLYAVFDGMGGASAGDVAANRARDVVHEYVRAKKKAMAPEALLEAALGAASAAVHGEAQRTRDRQGMGTTAVVALVIDDRRVVVAHVGDSRAYLLREGRLAQLTADHTVVAELVANGALSAADAENHAYKNVLSRNLGARPDTRADVAWVELVPGDRLMLCSDGLYGYASTDAIQYLLGATDGPEHVAKDLVDLALRGGGGDNVTAIVLEAGSPAVPRATQILRTSGAVAWWSRRATFLAEAERRGLAGSPICAVLSPTEAIEIVAGNLAEAIFHDLEKTTGVNVWTYAENLAHGWFDQGGEWPVLAALLDLLAASARAVVGELSAADEALALLVDAAVVRAFVTAEMAVGGVLAERLRQVEAELIRRHTHRHAAADESARFVDMPTTPLVGVSRGPASDAASPEVRALLPQLAQAARQAVGSTAPARQAVDALLRAALEATSAASPALMARELFGVRPLEESGISPLFDALDLARGAYVAALRRVGGEPAVAAGVMRRLAAAQCELAAAIAALVVEASAPSSDRLKDAMRETATLRAEVGRNEARLIELERRFASRTGQPVLPRLPEAAMSGLADRVMVLRDEVLDTVERGDRDQPGADVFEAIVRALAAHGETSPGIDLTLHDAIARRLAWGDSAELVLADGDHVFHRLAHAARRALREPGEEMLVLEVAAEVATQVARIVALSSLGRAQRDRAARTREELAQRRLRDALADQHATLTRLAVHDEQG